MNLDNPSSKTVCMDVPKVTLRNKTGLIIDIDLSTDTLRKKKKLGVIVIRTRYPHSVYLVPSPVSNILKFLVKNPLFRFPDFFRYSLHSSAPRPYLDVFITCDSVSLVSVGGSSKRVPLPFPPVFLLKGSSRWSTSVVVFG